MDREGILPEAAVSEAELDALRQFDTPTICNALELVAPERRALGFTTQTLIARSRAAADSRIRAHCPDPLALPSGQSAAEQRQARLEYYRTSPPAAGRRSWSSRTSIRASASALLGRGAGRDLQGARLPGRHRRRRARSGRGRARVPVLCGKVMPSHAWVHAITFGGTVDVFGMIARSDDLIHADRHGAVVIPREVAREVVRRPSCAPGARSRSSRWRAAPISRWTPSSARWPQPRRFTEGLRRAKTSSSVQRLAQSCLKPHRRQPARLALGVGSKAGRRSARVCGSRLTGRPSRRDATQALADATRHRLAR